MRAEVMAWSFLAAIWIVAQIAGWIDSKFPLEGASVNTQEKPRITLRFDPRDPIHPWHAYSGGLLRALSPCSGWAIQKCLEHIQQEQRDRDRARRKSKVPA